MDGEEVRGPVFRLILIRTRNRIMQTLLGAVGCPARQPKIALQAPIAIWIGGDRIAGASGTFSLQFEEAGQDAQM